MAARTPLVARSSLAVLSVAYAVLAAGCGGGGAVSTPAAPVPAATTATAVAHHGPSKATFIASADRRCRVTNRRLKPIIERIVRLDLSTQPVLYRLSGYRDAFHDLGIEYEDLVSELQQLEPPAREHRLVTRTLRLLDSIPLHLDRLQASITSLDVLSFLRAELKLNKAFVRLGGTADSYGFKVCGVVPGRHPRGNDGPLPLAKQV
jgi:hypothetical protein